MHLLKVVPLVKQEVTNEMTDEQKQEVEAINKKYDEAEKKLTEKAEKEAYDIAGFLAYDISLVDADGNKVEPNGDVKVTMDYKKPVIADEAVQTVQNSEDIDSTADLNVTVMHLEEDAQGQVKDVVDMVADESKGNAEIDTTEANEIKNVAITTDSFSTFAITYKQSSITVKYVNDEGNELTSDKFTSKGFDVSKKAEVIISNGEKINIPTIVTIDGKTYSYSGAKLNDINGSSVYSIRYKSKDDGWQYKATKDVNFQNMEQ